MPDDGYRQVSTTIDSKEAAEALASSAVRARVAACAQVLGPIASTYWWEGRVERAQEYLIVFKTPADRAGALQEHLLAAHPYDVPEIIAWPVSQGLPAYLGWVESETRA